MPENKDFLSKNEENKFSLGQKFVFGIVLLLGFGILGLGFVQIKHNLKDPFVLNKSGKATKEQKKESKSDLEKMLELKDKDTDKDGLSDYEELNIYNTSAYIEDSDSDGINDGEEVAQGEDPNCPKGKDCYGLGENKKKGPELESEDADFNEKNNADDFMEGLPTGDFIQKPSEGDLLQNSGLSQFGLGEDNVLGLLSQDMSADDIRDLLLQAGMDKAMLDKIDDQSLIKTYNSAVSDASIDL